MSSTLSGAAPIPAYLADLVDRRLAQSYPAWRITRFNRSDGSFGGWWAIRHAPITPAHRAAGLVGSIARPDLLTLVMEVIVQDDLAELVKATGRPEEGS